jgi:N-acetylglucosamine-6-sulfatase
VVFGAVAALLATVAAGLPAADSRAAPSGRPNVVVVMTDDQTAAAISVMPRTLGLIGGQGATFEHSFANFPLCCPSRATFLTGQYAHNHRVLNNIPPQGGFDVLKGDETLPVWLQRSGYYTGLVGKYLNGYETSAVGVPPGYDEWHGQKTQNAYYGYDLLEDGQLVRYGDPDEDPTDPAHPETYSSDVYTEKAVEFIGRRAPVDQPYFLWVAYNAPHTGIPDPPPGQLDRCRGNVKPAARHIGAFEDLPLPTPPSFNEADVSDKPHAIRALPPLDGFEIDQDHNLYRCELESLLAVDEGVQRIVDALAASGELDSTLLIFTSDNGMMHGEHRIPFGKNLPYEESARVPLLIRGPGIPAGVTVRDLVANVDLAPTILDASGAHPRLPEDGRSLLPLTRRPGNWSGRELAIEGNRYRGVRTARYLYVHWIRGPDHGATELYDLERDPYQLQNLHHEPGSRKVEHALAKRLRAVERCAGEECLTEPRLRLRASADGDSSEGGCPGGVVAGLAGKDAKQVIEASFTAGRSHRRADRSKPFEAEFPDRLASPRTRLRALAELRDGRRMSLATRPRC